MANKQVVAGFDRDATAAINSAFEEALAVLRARRGQEVLAETVIEELRRTLTQLAQEGEGDALVLRNRALALFE